MVFARASQQAAQVLVASNRGPVSYTLARGRLARPPSAAAADSSPASSRDRARTRTPCGCARRSATATARRCARRAALDREPAAVRTDAGHPGRRATPTRTTASRTPCCGSSTTCSTRPRWSPSSTRSSGAQWASYEAYNRAFAEALAEEAAEGAAVLVQDYHLALVPGHAPRAAAPTCGSATSRTRRGRPPDYFRLLPDDIAEQVLRGILGADRAAFLTRRWARRVHRLLRACWAPYRDERRGRSPRGRTTRIGVHGLGADADFLRERAAPAGRRGAHRRAARADRRGPDGAAKTIVRVDRTELSKNIVRGLLAYRQLLEDRPEWRERVVHVAFAYPSRQDLAVYRDYTAEVAAGRRRDQRAVRDGGLDPGRAARQGRLRPLAGGVPAGGRGAGQPDPGRHEPGRQGGPGRLRRRLRAGAVAGGGRVRGAGRGRDRGQPVRRRGHRRAPCTRR